MRGFGIRAVLASAVGLACLIAAGIWWSDPPAAEIVRHVGTGSGAAEKELLGRPRAPGPRGEAAAVASAASQRSLPQRPVLPRSQSCSDADPNWRPTGSSDVYTPEYARCRQCYLDMMKELAGSTGSDIVLGANDGKRYDPAWWFGYWNTVPQHTKVFVEPVRPIYTKLKHNMAEAAISNVLALNNAVRGSAQGSQLTLYCWDLDMVEQAVKHGASPLPPEARQPKEHWSFICGLDIEGLLAAGNVFAENAYAILPAGRKAEVRQEVEKHIVKYTVDALTPRQIVARAGPGDVRYVQIDVEGLDNDIVRSLPFGEDGFWPDVVLYEDHQGVEVKPLLQSFGYHVCCCFDKWGRNFLAVLDKPQLP